MESLIRKAKIELVILVNTDTRGLDEKGFVNGIKEHYDPEDADQELFSGHSFSVIECKVEEIKD